ncbi:unnamed protein product [Chironomus riparius]|uniref:Uncharacterized protein n=1 Tax=Chironomus riparius TaxID=315576 RepID=A0A9N9WM27_9DIPT|nr:unnamed protein product [Chironomus riparius]
MRSLQIILLLGIIYVVHGLSPFEKRRNPNHDDGIVIFFSGEIPDEDFIKGNLTNFFKQLSDRLSEARAANASNQLECLEDEDPDFIKNSIVWSNKSQPNPTSETHDENYFTEFRFVLADDAILRVFAVLVTVLSLILCYFIT